MDSEHRTPDQTDGPTPDRVPAPPATFADLGCPPALVHALKRSALTTARPIQAAAIPDALAGRDVLGRAPTGSGKTLAFGLPMLLRLRGGASKPAHPRALVLVPTRELALQVVDALDDPALALGLRVAAVVGGVPLARQAQVLGRGIDLVVATPGRLADHVARGTVALDHVVTTTLDEADHLAELGFVPQVRALLDRTPPSGQRLLFSATLDEDVAALIDDYLRDPVTHTAVAEPTPAPRMRHHLFVVAERDKDAVVDRIAARRGRTIVFVRTKPAVDALAARLRAAGVVADGLHGDLTQPKRVRALNLFRDGTTPVLVSTDVAARGIHVDDIGVVLHADPAGTAKDYLHRAGRTARADASGVVITVVTETELPGARAVLRQAQIDAEPLRVRPDSAELREIAGAREPSGRPIPATPPAPEPAAEPQRTARNPGRDRRPTHRGRGPAPGRRSRRK
ncbi:DEAD/DEAH box helicase [Speluncibacter jeojiensis]|uniref:DEAD/DEAH box helicase n=1 Tax=Speluncibacter jeojiensis TaxID=2710754 RepID=A0A9X4LYX0_9ACTN|nr:DEAD/DEAH box helicase [Corynebacteriales bacterium D3-21]